MPRPPRPDHVEILVRAARMHYEEHLAKGVIAERLGMSPTHVKRLLDEASARGIVRIAVVERRDFDQLEKSLVVAFGLKAVRIAPYTSDYERQKTAIGHVAAQLFEELAVFGTAVGIGGGGSLKAMVEALDTHPREIRIAPMALVGRGPEIEHVDAAFLAAMLYYKSAPKARAYVVGMLPPPKQKSPREQFIALVEKSIPEVAAVLDKARSSSLAFIGLGSPEPVPELVPVLVRSGLSAADLKRRRVAGGINYSYFDEQGEEIARFFTTVPIADLKTMSADPQKTVVIVAGGGHKIDALEIALRTRIGNSLVTDERTALKLVASAKQAPADRLLEVKEAM
jgi:deoxyribonucleoside regulator